MSREPFDYESDRDPEDATLLGGARPRWRRALSSSSASWPLCSARGWADWALKITLGCALGALLAFNFRRPVLSVYDARALVVQSRLGGHTPEETMRWLNSTDALPDEVAHNLALTYAECDAGFPAFWPELEATREVFLKPRDGENGGITQKDLDRDEELDGIKVAIINNQLFIKRWSSLTRTRALGVLASLHQALSSSPEPIPDVEFWFRTTDTLEQGGWWALNKRPGELAWLLPDYGFWSWPEPGVKGWNDYRRKVLDVEGSLSWQEKGSKLFFRGAFLSKLRKALHELGSRYDWLDMAEIDWAQGAQARIEMADHCRHKYLAAIEGWGAYSGRLKYLLMCHSVVVSHKMQWTQHFHGAFVTEGSEQNIVELGWMDWGALPGEMDKLLGNESYAQNIADNAVRTMRNRYLTPAATACYWRRALVEYATLQQFTPAIGGAVDYESFAMMERVSWEPSK